MQKQVTDNFLQVLPIERITKTVAMPVFLVTSLDVHQNILGKGLKFVRCSINCNCQINCLFF